MAEKPQREARVISITDESRRKARKIGAGEVTASTSASTKRKLTREAGKSRSRSRSAPVPIDGEPGVLTGLVSDPRLNGFTQFVRRRLSGQYVVDEYGYDEELTEDVLLPIVKPLYEHYWRVETKGIENVPAHGPAMLACNHSGVVPWDVVMVMVALREEHPARPVLRMLTSDSIWDLPFISQWARKSGTSAASDTDALRMLGEGELVGIFPEGTKGIGKLFRDRYKLQRFVRTGFIEVALRTGAPIIPVGIVGAEETFPMLANASPIARLLGLPYFPITPTFPFLGALGALPLPSKWIIEFGEPIDTSQYGAEAAADPMTVFNIGDGIRDTLQQILYRNLLERGSWFW